jgi:hypothetical protein
MDDSNGLKTTFSAAAHLGSNASVRYKQGDMLSLQTDMNDAIARMEQLKMKRYVGCCNSRRVCCSGSPRRTTCARKLSAQTSLLRAHVELYSTTVDNIAMLSILKEVR